MAKLSCPNCGSNTFIGTLTKGYLFVYDNDSVAPTKKEIDELGEELTIYKCASCKEKVSMDDLVSTVECACCKEIVSANEVDDNGLCLACSMAKDTNKSPAELLRELLKAQASGSNINVRMNKKTEIANKNKEQEESVSVEAKIEEIESKEETVTEEPKKKRRGRPKKNTTVTEESETETTEEIDINNTTEDSLPFMNESVEAEPSAQDTDTTELDNLQAPFPEVDEEIKALGQSSLTEDIMNDTEDDTSFPVFNMFDAEDMNQEIVSDSSQAF